MYVAWITAQFIFTLYKNKDMTAYLIQAESLNHLDISSPTTITIQNILKVLAENSLTLIYSAMGTCSRIKAFYQMYHISSGSSNYFALLLEEETTAKTITDLQSYSHYLTARLKGRVMNPDMQSLPITAGPQFLIVCSMHSQLFKIQKVYQVI